MIDRLSKAECCGCNVCGDACPTSAISYKKDKEGFWYPQINSELCINCGLCEKVCPEINSEKVNTGNLEKPECYAAVNKNLQVRFDSTSGGAFSAFAKEIYKQKGYVGGAIWNSDWSVSHYISNNKDDIEKLRSSKYIQSNAEGFYKEVKALLDKDEKVLLCGTPCQIAGLKLFLKKDYENLILLDFVCQYVNSPLIWEKYIQHLEKRFDSKVVYIKDKNKELGWRTLTNKVVFENGEVLYDSKDKNLFRRCYMNVGVASRPSCYQCSFKGFPRIADVSLADFWGVEKYLPQEYDNNLGTSLILVNSAKGRRFFDDKIKKSMNVTPISFESTLGGNKALSIPFSPQYKVPREEFYKRLNEEGFEPLVNDYLSKINKHTLKQKVKNILIFTKKVIDASGLSLTTLYKNIYYNFFSRNVKTSIVDKKFIIINKHTRFDLHRTALIELGGILELNRSSISSKEANNFLIIIMEHGVLRTMGNYVFGSGCNIQIFKNAEFRIEGGGNTNAKCEFVCGKNLVFGAHVYLGRNIVIRDTNGEHYMSRNGYKTSRTVKIDTHAWICDRATIMPGVHIYPGGIVGASSFVTSNVPAFSLVSGNPAIVVDEDVYWKD